MSAHPVLHQLNTRVYLTERSRELGMQTFDQALFDLYEAGAITYEDCLRNADRDWESYERDRERARR
jgi:Tfp pilus assembly ATPase PilU